MSIDKNKYLKGFTLVEVLIALILTSIAITFSYGTLSYIQKVFNGYKDQNRFINEYCRLKNAMEVEALRADMVIMNGEGEFSVRRDSIVTDIVLGAKNILLKRNSFCDTFHIAPVNAKVRFETMNDPAWTNRLVKSLSFDLEYNKQKFNFYFCKSYDASVKMKLDKME
jgi:prepilin-type N-terminal cleavage/methylation domain-containing protein